MGSFISAIQLCEHFRPLSISRIVQKHRTISRQENITYSSPIPAVSGGFSSLSPLPTPERVYGRTANADVTTKVLGWIDYQIFFAPGLRAQVELRYYHA